MPRLVWTRMGGGGFMLVGPRKYDSDGHFTGRRVYARLTRLPIFGTRFWMSL